jgi:hypothetical protein
MHILCTHLSLALMYIYLLVMIHPVESYLVYNTL